jgi:RNA polymerase sigma-70 factor (ECF subfamily)
LILLKTIEKLKANDGEAQKLVYNTYGNMLFVIAKRYMGDTMLAEDMMVNAFVSIFKAVSKTRFEALKPFEVWMRRIVINECLSELRRKSTFKMLPQEAGEQVGVAPDVIDKMGSEEILEIVAQLPTGYRTVFNLFEMEGFSHKEIAQKLSISEGTSKSQLSHAKRMLRIKITGLYGKEARYRY